MKKKDFGSVFVSCGSCNKLLQIWWFKITQIYFLTAPKARSPKSVSLGRDQGISRLLTPHTLKENLFLNLFQLLVAASISWLVATSH